MATIPLIDPRHKKGSSWFGNDIANNPYVHGDTLGRDLNTNNGTTKTTPGTLHNDIKWAPDSDTSGWHKIPKDIIRVSETQPTTPTNNPLSISSEKLKSQGLVGLNPNAGLKKEVPKTQPTKSLNPQAAALLEAIKAANAGEADAWKHLTMYQGEPVWRSTSPNKLKVSIKEAFPDSTPWHQNKIKDRPSGHYANWQPLKDREGYFGTTMGYGTHSAYNWRVPGQFKRGKIDDYSGYGHNPTTGASWQYQLKKGIDNLDDWWAQREAEDLELFGSPEGRANWENLIHSSDTRSEDFKWDPNWIPTPLEEEISTEPSEPIAEIPPEPIAEIPQTGGKTDLALDFIQEAQEELNTIPTIPDQLNEGGEDLAFWGKKEPPDPSKRLPHGPRTNVHNWYNSGGSLGEIPEGWTEEDVEEYMRNEQEGFQSRSIKKGIKIADVAGTPGKISLDSSGEWNANNLSNMFSGPLVAGDVQNLTGLNLDIRNWVTDFAKKTVYPNVKKSVAEEINRKLGNKGLSPERAKLMKQKANVSNVDPWLHVAAGGEEGVQQIKSWLTKDYADRIYYGHNPLSKSLNDQSLWGAAKTLYEILNLGLKGPEQQRQYFNQYTK